MKTITITPPEGHEIDKENSTFECIVFKPIKKQLPKTWEDLEELSGWYVDAGSRCHQYSGDSNPANRTTCLTKSQAKASIALAQLTQLREVYRQGWKPNWKQHVKKYVICLDSFAKPSLIISQPITRAYFLAFQSHEIAEEFLTNFKDLIIQAAPLLFGEEIN